MNSIEETRPDNHKLTFETEARPVRYGDNKRFYEYRIVMFHGMSAVGVEDGPRRQTQRKSDCFRMARARLVALRSHRLFIIHVTKKHIEDGEARSCQTCAIAQALWHNQERMGFSRYSHTFDVSPYGAWTSPRGIVLERRYGNEESRISAENLPYMVMNWRDQIYTDSMFEWAMRWDEWAESRDMSLKEWREDHGYESNDYPSKPGPCSFVLDLDEFKKMGQEEIAAA